MDRESMAKEVLRYMKIVEKGPAKEISAVSRGEMAMLDFLVTEQTVTTPTELSVRLALSTARVANTLNSLERKGYVERIHDVVDRRKVLVHATDTGKAFFLKEEKKALAHVKEIFEDLGEKDSMELVRLLKKVRLLMEHKNSEAFASESAP